MQLQYLQRQGIHIHVSCESEVRRNEADVFNAHSFCDGKQLTFTEGSLENLTQYLFNTKRNEHYFCPDCGSAVLMRGARTGVIGVNLRCVEGVDVDRDALVCKDVDGKKER